MPILRFTILGCGSSGGVPRLGGKWGACDPGNPKNRRQRCSLLIQQFDGGRATQVLVDSSPDMRAQLLAADVGYLDGVVYTHSHADHVNGLDDLRMIYHNAGTKIPVWADEVTAHALRKRFGYAFRTPKGSQYPPVLKMNRMDGPVMIDGAGGRIALVPFKVGHGYIVSNGIRVGDVAYLPDVSEMYQESWDAVSGLDCWIVDALRRDPHPTHTHLEQTLEWIERAKPRRAILTNMHNDLDYCKVSSETPSNVEPAFDGMKIEYEI